MTNILRIAAASLLAIALCACSAASQNASAPGQQIAPNVPAAAQPAPAPGHHKTKPHDVTGGGGGKAGVGITIQIGDVSLPNASKVQAINLGIDEVYVTDGSGNVTVVEQNSAPQVVNVMAYQGGNTTPVAQGSVPPTTYASMTIIVDTSTSNYVGGAGNTRQMTFANGQGSRSAVGFGNSTSTSAGPSPGTEAITFNKAFQVAGSAINVDVDFNAMESFLPGSNNTATSRPSLTVAQQGFEGSIQGNVTNANGNGAVTNAVVIATDNNGVAEATGFTDSNGNFLLHTLVAGTYQLTINNHYTSASGWAIDSVNSTQGGTISGPSTTVSAGQTGNVGTIQD